MTRAASITSRIGGGDAQRITLRGHDLVQDLLGRHDFVETFYLACFGFFPSAEMRRMVNALLLSSVDHGLTPSALAARLTLHGSPDSVQGAVAAGLLGAGSRFLGSAENSCTFLRAALGSRSDWPDAELADHARILVAESRAQRRKMPGFGHPIHVEADPRVDKLLGLARECGFHGVHCRLAAHLSAALSNQTGHAVPMNAAGAKGAILADMDVPVEFAKGLSIVGRAAGLIAHVIEERAAPLSQALWDLAEQANTARASQPGGE